MDPDRAERLMWTLMVVCFTAAFFILLGELLGWWNDFGEIGLVVTTIVGALGGVAAVFLGSSSDQVRNVHEAVRENGTKLDSVDGKLGSVDGKLGSVDGKLEKLDELDVIQAELDHQTGALDRQVSVLTQIRDRL